MGQHTKIVLEPYRDTADNRLFFEKRRFVVALGHSCNLTKYFLIVKTDLSVALRSL